MKDGFDLNIINYSVQDCEDIFDIHIKNYDYNFVIEQEQKLRHNITNDLNINPIIKTQTLTFLTEVKNTLISNIKLHLDKNDIYDIPDIVNSKPFIIKNINIDSRFRPNWNSQSSSNFDIQLPVKLHNIISMRLSAIEFGNVIYTISSKMNNHFFIIEIEGLTPLTVTISDGNYTHITLQNFINNFLSTTPYNNIEVSIADPYLGDGLMTIKSNNTDNFSLDFSKDIFGNDDNINPLPLKLGWIMGYREGYYNHINICISEAPVNLNGHQYIYLVVNDFTNSSVNEGFHTAFNFSTLNKNILARISLKGNLVKYLTKNIPIERHYFGPVDIQKLQLQIIDEYGRILDLNYGDYSCCLTFKTMYKG